MLLDSNRAFSYRNQEKDVSFLCLMSTTSRCVCVRANQVEQWKVVFVRFECAINDEHIGGCLERFEAFWEYNCDMGHVIFGVDRAPKQKKMNDSSSCATLHSLGARIAVPTSSTVPLYTYIYVYQ